LLGELRSLVRGGIDNVVTVDRLARDIDSGATILSVVVEDVTDQTAGLPVRVTTVDQVGVPLEGEKDDAKRSQNNQQKGETNGPH